MKLTDEQRQVKEELLKQVHKFVGQENLISKIKTGDIVIDSMGQRRKVIDIQYEHNRYQLSGTSGWLYGIERLYKEVEFKPLCYNCNHGMIYCGECDPEEYLRKWPEKEEIE